ARSHEMHRGRPAGVEPVAREIERRTIADFQPQYVAVEILGALQIGRLDGVVLQSAKWHRVSPWIKLDVDAGAGAPGATGIEMVEPGRPRRASRQTANQAVTASSLSICSID